MYFKHTKTEYSHFEAYIGSRLFRLRRGDVLIQLSLGNDMDIKRLFITGEYYFLITNVLPTH